MNLGRASVAALALATVLATGTAGCGDGGAGSKAKVGVSLELRHSEPLRTGATVRWSLVLRNDTLQRVALRFPSGKDGDVVLHQGGEERYRWSADRVFTTAVRDLRVGPGETRTFALEDPAFAVPVGDYDLVATLATELIVLPVERRITIVA